MGILTDTASFGSPAQQPIIPFPFQEIAAIGSQVQARADKNMDRLNSVGDALLQQQVLPKDEIRKRQLFNDFYQKSNDLIDNSGGVMSDINFRNGMRNLVRETSMNPELLNMSRNLKAVQEEQKKMLSISDYRPWNDPNKQIREAILTGQLGTEDIGLYRNKSYQDNQEVDKRLDNIFDDLKDSGYYVESPDGEGYIIGRGYDGVSWDRLQQVANDNFMSFMRSDAGQEFQRKAAYQLGVDSIDVETAKALYDIEMKGRMSENFRQTTKQTLKSDATGLANKQAIGIEGLSQNTSAAPALSDMGSSFEYKNGKVELSDDFYNKAGISWMSSFTGNEKVPMSKATDKDKELIEVASKISGRPVTDDYRKNMEMVQEVANEWYASPRFQQVQYFTGSELKMKNDLLDASKNSLDYMPEGGGDKLDFTELLEEHGEDIKVEFVNQWKGDNPLGPGTQTVRVVDDKGKEHIYLANNIEGVAARPENHIEWVKALPQQTFSGETIEPLDYMTKIKVEDKGLSLEQKKKELANSPHIRSKIDSWSGSTPIFRMDRYENGKVVSSFKAYGREGDWMKSEEFDKVYKNAKQQR